MKKLYILLITPLLAFGQNPVSDGLILEYNTFKTSSYNGTGTTIYDLSGNNRNGTIVGSPIFTSNYFIFSNDYITTPNIQPDLTSNAHTTEVWIYPTGDGVIAQYAGQVTPNTSYHHSAIEISSGNLYFSFFNGSGLTSSTGTPITLNQWNQVVLSYDGTTILGYLNGNVVSTTLVSWDSPFDGGGAETGNYFIQFGAATATNAGDGSDFDGRFGIVWGYNKALSALEVDTNYSAGNASLSVQLFESKRALIYPNPTLSTIHINKANFSEAVVFDLQGRELMRTTSKTIDLSQLSNNIYLIKILDEINQTTRTYKVVKE